MTTHYMVHNMNRTNKYRQAFETLSGIAGSYSRAESMSTDELTTRLAELKIEGGEPMTSLESAIKAEAIHRLNSPFTWRINLWLERIKRHAH